MTFSIKTPKPGDRGRGGKQAAVSELRAKVTEARRQAQRNPNGGTVQFEFGGARISVDDTDVIEMVVKQVRKDLHLD